MAIRYYDEALLYKLKKWIPDGSTLRVLKPDESKRFFELTANDNRDQAFKLPLLAVSRDSDIELLLNVKNPKSFDGIRLTQDYQKGNIATLSKDGTLIFNVIPIKLVYQLDIYTKTAEEGEEYLRNFLFKLINNPSMRIGIPYNNTNLEHVANIRVLNSVSDTSSITERLFSGQFTRWTIQLEILDAFLFNIPYKKNWMLDGIEFEVLNKMDKDAVVIESDKIEIKETNT